MSGEIPTYDRAELEALQLTRLRETLTRVYDAVPHYTRAFDDAGVHPDDLTSLADLARFPFTTKADLRANYPFGPSTSLCSTAYSAACVRDASPSLPRMLDT